jgi:hypothetical protein
MDERHSAAISEWHCTHSSLFDFEDADGACPSFA